MAKKEEQIWKLPYRTQQDQMEKQINKLLSVLEVNNPHNALEKTKGLINRIFQLESTISEICELTGTKTIGNAKQRIRALLSRETPDNWGNLPEDFLGIPKRWLEGSPGEHNKPGTGIPPMRASIAARLHKTLLPLIKEAWELAGDDEDVKAQILTAYRTSPAKKFENDIWDFCGRLTPLTLEEEAHEEALRREQAEQRFDNWAIENANARDLGKLL